MHHFSVSNIALGLALGAPVAMGYYVVPATTMTSTMTAMPAVTSVAVAGAVLSTMAPSYGHPALATPAPASPAPMGYSVVGVMGVSAPAPTPAPHAAPAYVAPVPAPSVPAPVPAPALAPVPFYNVVAHAPDAAVAGASTPATGYGAAGSTASAGVDAASSPVSPPPPTPTPGPYGLASPNVVTGRGSSTASPSGATSGDSSAGLSSTVTGVIIALSAVFAVVFGALLYRSLRSKNSAADAHRAFTPPPARESSARGPTASGASFLSEPASRMSMGPDAFTAPRPPLAAWAPGPAHPPMPPVPAAYYPQFPAGGSIIHPHQSIMSDAMSDASPSEYSVRNSDARLSAMSFGQRSYSFQ